MKKLYTLLLLLSIFQYCYAENLYEQELQKSDSISSAISLSRQKIDSKGIFQGLVILVEFIDTPFTVLDTKEKFHNMLNSSGYCYQGARGSVRDYFIDNSDSLFLPQFTVVGPVQLDKPMEYYGENGENGEEINSAEMVKDACRIVSSQIKFSDYDSNNDDIVDMIYVIFASYGENENRDNTEYIWPHAGNIAESNLIIDDKLIGRYACSAEYSGKKMADTPPQMATIGIFCHEFSHTLGLPDFYNTRSGSGLTLGSLSIMDRGNFLDNGRCPAGYSAFEKEYLEWIEIPTIEVSDSITLSPLNTIKSDSNRVSALKVAIPNTKEYFYFENRQREGWDMFLPGTGLFIYHVDRSDETAWDENEVNIDYKHPCYRVIRSGGEYTTDYERISFPGRDSITIFTPEMWTKEETIDFELQNIRESNKEIKFDLIYDLSGNTP